MKIDEQIVKAVIDAIGVEEIPMINIERAEKAVREILSPLVFSLHLISEGQRKTAEELAENITQEVIYEDDKGFADYFIKLSEAELDSGVDHRKEYRVKKIITLLAPYIKTPQDEKKLAMWGEMANKIRIDNGQYTTGYCLICKERFIPNSHHSDCIISRLDAADRGE